MKFDWDKHYREGGLSGDPADYEKSRGWKHNILREHYNPNTDSILDLACGDLQFWNGNPPLNYIGVDISQTIIDRHKKKFPTRKFICSNAAIKLNIKADVVICFDMLWHIIDDDEYINTLQNIKTYSKKYIYIYTWNSDPVSFTTHIASLFVKKNDIEYQKYRNYRAISDPIFSPEFELVEVYTNNVWKIGSMYVYKRMEK